MAESNPYRRTAHGVAFGCYVLAGLVFLAAIFFALGGATVDVARVPIQGVTNLQLAVMGASPFLIFVVLLVAFGRLLQNLFGRPRRQEKIAAKSAVGCLRLGSLGCGLWSLCSAVITLIVGKMFITNEPAGIKEVLVGTSGFVLAIILMLAVAWFISANYARTQPEERDWVYKAYLDTIKPHIHRLADPETRTYVQEQTLEVLEKLDLSLKCTLLGFLSESGLLSGPSRIMLHDADFRRVDMRSISLPQADLRGIDLERADLQGVILFKVNLQKAKLKNANLSRANLQGADLRQADLTGVLLEKTNLSDADLRGARVTLEQLKQARLQNTKLPDDKE